MSDTQNHTKPNVPNLRFPGFEGEWEECTIKDFGRVVTGSTPPTSDNRYYENGLRLWASPTDLRGDKYISETCTKLSEDGFAKTRVIPQGSTMVTCIGSTIGKMGMASCEMSTNQQINSVISNTQTDSHFLYYAIQARFPRYSQSIAVQAVPILSKSSFEQLKNYRPLLQEQQKIGSFLDLIDRRISIQNKVIEKYESLIKAITKRLVCCKGQQCLLGDIADIYQPRTITGMDMSICGRYPVFGANGIIGYYVDYNHTLPQICIACRGNTCGALNYSLPFSWITGNSMVINVDSSSSTVNKRFLFHLLSTLDYSPLISGSGQPQIVRGPLQKLRITLPEKQDQDKIANVIDCLLERLNVENTILRNSQSQKRFLLAKLFI